MYFHARGFAHLATVAIALAASLAGCAVPMPTYTVASANVAAIREFQRGIDLQSFSGDPKSVSCRAIQIGPDNGRTFAQYIQAAFNDEVVIAGVKKSLPTTKLAIDVKSVSLDCAIGTGSWSFEVEVKVQDQSPFVLRSSRDFNGSFDGMIVRERAMQALVPSVQKLIQEVIAHPTFKRTFGGAA